MLNQGQLYTCGLWVVKPGMEQSFMDAWQAFANWTSQHQAGAGNGILLRDEAEPNRFISFGPWDKAENIIEWRSREEFQQFLAVARELCEEVRPHTMKVAGYSRQ